MLHISTREIAPGDVGIVETLVTMRRLARQPSVAVQLLAYRWTVGEGDKTEQAMALRRELFARYIYMDDLPAETLGAPDVLGRQVQATGCFVGDCDELAMFAAALGLALGIPARFIVVEEGLIHRAPFSHVFTSLDIPTAVGYHSVDFDLTRPTPTPPIARVMTMMV